jgi:Mitochondrial mRNA-processing protein COX24, C-terminal
LALARARPPEGRDSRHADAPGFGIEGGFVGSVIKKRRKRMAKKKHRKLLRKTRVQRRNKK